jgi:hypothetical protein
MDVKNVADTSAKTEQDDLVQNNVDNQNPAGNKASLESNDAEMEHRAARSEDCEQRVTMQKWNTVPANQRIANSWESWMFLTDCRLWRGEFLLSALL